MAENCSANNLTWIHIYPNPYTNIRLGNKGILDVTGSSTYEFCAGNNEDSYEYRFPGRPTETQDFYPGFALGYEASNRVTITQINITGWEGNATCPES